MRAVTRLIRGSFRSAEGIAVFAMCLCAPLTLSLVIVSVGYYNFA